MQLTRSNAPWAFTRDGQPYRVIAALEAFGVLLAVRTFSPLIPRDSDTVLSIPGVTDNRGNAFVLNKLMSTKYPLCCIVMELAACMEESNLRIELEWTPRESNQEADALSNQNSTGFTEELRVPLSLEDEKWIVLQEMLTQGEIFEKERKAVREQTRVAAQTSSHIRKGQQTKLKEREPW